MGLLHRRNFGTLLSLLSVGLILTNVFLFAINIEPVFGAGYLTLKWTRPLGNNGRMDIGPLAADLNNDGKMEIVVSGGTLDYSGTQGTVRALNGDTGATLWTYTGNGITPHTPLEIANLDKVGALEIVVPNFNGPMALRGDTGSVYWQRTDVVCGNLYSAVYDVNGDGYPEVFVNRHHGMYYSYDYDTCLSYDGTVLNQAWAWHSCWGGFTIADANFDGRFEIYQGDRSSAYSGENESYFTGGMGVRALDALTLTPLWNDPQILCSSQSPILADVDKDGILDVIVLGQSGLTGPVVLNSADGSVVTTGGKYRKGASGVSAHSQGTVYDVDGDGNLEIISARSSSPTIWDLYDWKLDATLPIECYEPPRVGDVTGDGKMDIIATTLDGQHIYVYSYIDGAYVEVDHVTGMHGANTFSLVQDVDDDGYNELVVTSLSGEVYCYDTLGRVTTPKIRSTTPFYSEYRRGAAEYVPSPSDSVVRPALSDEQPANGALNQALNPTLSITASDFQGHPMDIVFGTNVTGTWVDIPGGNYTNVVNGMYNATPTNMNNYGTKYYWSVNATDRVTQKWSYNVYSFTTSSRIPTQGVPLLVSSLGNNGTKEDLTCSNRTTADPDHDNVTNIYDWNVDGSSLTNLLLPFDTRTDSGTRALLTDGFEVNFNNWDGNGATNWDRATSNHSGEYSAHAAYPNTYLTSDDLDTSTADGITVSFWYLDSGIDANDDVYLQFYDGSTYKNIFEIGTNGPKGVWHQYSLWYRTLFQYQIPNFRIRFDAHLIDSDEELWIDDVSITIGGAPAKDYSDQSNDGGVHGATWTSDGVVGGAYNFDGNDYIRINENGNSLGGDGSWSQLSVEFWVKATADTSTYPLIMKHDRYNYTTGSRAYGLGYQVDFRATATTNVVTWYVYTPSRNMLTYTIPSGARDWHHVVCTYDSGPGLRLYVDGVQVGSLAAGGNINATRNGPLNIGHEGSGYFVGMLDEVGIYSRALSPFQISKRYNETKNGLSKNSTIASQETEVGEVWRCEVTPNDSFGDGASTLSNTLTVLTGPNTPPNATGPTIMPSPPTSSQDLTATYTYSDAEGDPEWGTEIRWYKNAVLQINLTDWSTVPASLTLRGEKWNFTVRPRDGTEFGILQTSPTVTILNSPPTFTGMYITPDPALETSTLTANPYGWYDDDNDTEGYRYQWQNFTGTTWNNITGQTSKTLNPAYFRKGDYVRVNCTAYDGTSLGTSILGSTWIVDSYPPTHANPLLVSSLGGNTTAEDLICYNQSTTDPEGDEVTDIYHWSRNGNSITNLLMPFDTNSSVTANDYSGYNNHGTWNLTGNWTSDGVVGGAYVFDGNDYIRINENGSSLGGDGSWSQLSVEFWVKATINTGAERVIWKHVANYSRDEAAPYGIGYRVDFSATDTSNNVFWYVYTPSQRTVNCTIAVGPRAWHHVVCTYASGTGLRLYVDGLLANSTVASGNINATRNGPLYIGYESQSNDFRGMLDEVRIYPKALTAAQVSQRCIETKDGLTSSSTIANEEIAAGDVWTCQVIPNDHWQDGTAKTSNPLEVLGGGVHYGLLVEVSPVGSGTTNATGTHLYDNGTIVRVQASPSAGWTLSHWLRNGSNVGVTDPYAITMDANYNLTAVFVEGVPRFFADGFESGSFASWSGTSGTPTVVSSPVHDGSYALQCDASGEVVYKTGISGYATVYTRFYVRISALPANGQSVKIAKAVNTGLSSVWELYFRRSGGGALQIWLRSSVPSQTDQYYAYSYAVNTWYCFEVKYSQSAAGEYRVRLNDAEILSRTGVDTSSRQVNRLELGIQWSNYVVTTYHDCVVIDQNYIGPEAGVLYALNISVVGTACSTVPSVGEHLYAPETTATVTANPGLGWKFDHWTLDGSPAVSTNPIEVSMNANHTLTAVFAEVSYGLVVEVRGSGTTDPAPGTYTYPAGTVVSVDAIPDSGWALSYWLRNGSNVGVTDPYAITMDANYNLTAVFVEGVPRFFADGFESGSFASWSGTSGTPQIVDSPVHHDDHAALFNPRGAYEYCYKTLDSSQSTVYHRFYVRVDELPNANGEKYDLSRGYAGGTVIWQTAIADSSGLRWSINYRSGATWTQVNSDVTTINTGTWYCIELYWKLGATDGEVHLYIDGTEVITVTGIDTNNYGNCDTIRNGVSSYTGTFTGPNVYEDCIVVDDAYIGTE